MDYIRIDFRGTDEQKSAMIIASLIPYSYEGFEETNSTLSAYIKDDEYDADVVAEIAEKFKTGFTSTFVKQTNWNAEWESSFQPVCVGDFAGIRAEFHPPLKNVKHEIIITPKMSFGTGHHATTYMMIEQMEELDFTGKSVFDFGTGTGVLAILARKMGARSVVATDYDSLSIDNSEENILGNQITGISTILSDKVPSGKFDIILANINKNVITENFPALKNALNVGAILLVSGLLETDEKDIVYAATALDLILINKINRNNWISLKFIAHIS